MKYINILRIWGLHLQYCVLCNYYLQYYKPTFRMLVTLHIIRVYIQRVPLGLVHIRFTYTWLLRRFSSIWDYTHAVYVSILFLLFVGHIGILLTVVLMLFQESRYNVTIHQRSITDILIKEVKTLFCSFPNLLSFILTRSYCWVVLVLNILSFVHSISYVDFF